MTEPAARAASPLGAAWISALPLVWVVLWSTGFLGAKMGLPHAEPFTFLLLRFVAGFVVIGAIVVVTRAPWPTTWAEAGHTAAVGVMINGLHLGGVFTAIHHGVPAGVAAIIVAIHPLITAAGAGFLLGEPVTGRLWLGLVLGLTGVGMVVANKLTLGSGDAIGMFGIAVAVLGISAAMLYQKRFGAGMKLRSGAAIQFAAGAAVMAVLALSFDTMEVRWNGEFVFALAWLIVVLSLGAFNLLYVLIRQGLASRVASLFYLVPPVTALMAYFLFGETLNWIALLGMVVTVLGVATATRA